MGGLQGHSPLQKAIWRIRIAMMLEHALNLSSDHNFLHRIAQQVTDHAHVTGMREFDKHSDVGTVVLEDRVGRVPDTLPTEDAPPRIDLSPFGIEGVATVTQPFRSELPGPTMAAALYE
jgi:hypothetical protein